ncbi:MAG: SCO family protein [Proteobacteria bacterium]|nr:SCO family protein [Pseudomonadota bacterium]
MGPKRFKGKIAAVAALLALIGSAGAAAAETAAQPAAFPVDLGGPFALVDHTGRAVSDEDFRGRFMLVFFGYANCPGICPIGLRTMVEAVDLLGERSEAVAPILITVDPAHDTPANLAPAVAKIHPRLIGLTGTLEALSATAKAYKVSAKPAGRSWQGVDLFDHGSFIYLMGPDGKFLTLFPPNMPPDAMAAAIGRYLG